MSDIHEIAKRLNLKQSGREFRGDCPACHYPGTFSMTQRGAAVLWSCASCRDGNAIGKALQGIGYHPAAHPPSPRRPEMTNTDRQVLAIKIFREAKIISLDDPVSRYLVCRQIGHMASIPSLRYHPNCWHPQGKFPAMIGLCLNVSSAPMGIHRTYLTDSGAKAAISPVKSTLGPIAGCAIRLHPGDPREIPPEIVVAEGIETAAAAGRLLDLPPWSGLSAGNLAKTLILPPQIRHVTIAADNDPTGLQAAQAAATRWQYEGREVRIVTVDRAGADLADLLAEREDAPCK